MQSAVKGCDLCLAQYQVQGDTGSDLPDCQTTKVILTKVFPKSLGACTWIKKVNSSSRLYSCSMKGTNIARVGGQWLNNRPNCSVPEIQMTAPKLELAFLIYFPPPVPWTITVTSLNDIMIICSTFSTGKPLHICRGNAIIHLHIHQHHCWNSELLPLHPSLIVFSLTWISCLWHSPQVFWCTLTLEPRIYLQYLQQNTGMYNK